MAAMANSGCNGDTNGAVTNSSNTDGGPPKTRDDYSPTLTVSPAVGGINVTKTCQSTFPAPVFSSPDVVYRHHDFGVNGSDPSYCCSSSSHSLSRASVTDDAASGSALSYFSQQRLEMIARGAAASSDGDPGDDELLFDASLEQIPPNVVNQMIEWFNTRAANRNESGPIGDDDVDATQQHRQQQRRQFLEQYEQMVRQQQLPPHQRQVALWNVKPTSPKSCLEVSSIQQNMGKTREHLKRKLCQRPKDKELIERGILVPGSSATIIEKGNQLRRQQMKDRLSKKLQTRPDRMYLEEHNILKVGEGKVDQHILNAQNNLKSRTIQKCLDVHLQNRPPASVLHSILQPGDRTASKHHTLVPPALPGQDMKVSPIPGLFMPTTSGVTPTEDDSKPHPPPKPVIKLKFHEYLGPKAKQTRNKDSKKEIKQEAIHNYVKSEPKTLYDGSSGASSSRASTTAAETYRMGVVQQAAFMCEQQITLTQRIRDQQQLRPTAVVQRAPGHHLQQHQSTNRRASSLSTPSGGHAATDPNSRCDTTPPTPGSPLPQDEATLHTLRVAELKASCKVMGLSSTGTKQDLVNRLMAHRGTLPRVTHEPSGAAFFKSEPSSPGELLFRYQQRHGHGNGVSPILYSENDSQPGYYAAAKQAYLDHHYPRHGSQQQGLLKPRLSSDSLFCSSSSSRGNDARFPYDVLLISEEALRGCTVSVLKNECRRLNLGVGTGAKHDLVKRLLDAQARGAQLQLSPPPVAISAVVPPRMPPSDKAQASSSMSSGAPTLTPVAGRPGAPSCYTGASPITIVDPAPTATSQLGEEFLQKCRVAELKDECKRLELTRNGTKQDIINRLLMLQSQGVRLEIAKSTGLNGFTKEALNKLKNGVVRERPQSSTHTPHSSCSSTSVPRDTPPTQSTSCLFDDPALTPFGSDEFGSLRHSMPSNIDSVEVEPFLRADERDLLRCHNRTLDDVLKMPTNELPDKLALLKHFLRHRYKEHKREEELRLLQQPKNSSNSTAIDRPPAPGDLVNVNDLFPSDDNNNRVGNPAVLSQDASSNATPDFLSNADRHVDLWASPRSEMGMLTIDDMTSSANDDVTTTTNSPRVDGVGKDPLSSMSPRCVWAGVDGDNVDIEQLLNEATAGEDDVCCGKPDGGVDLFSVDAMCGYSTLTKGQGHSKLAKRPRPERSSYDDPLVLGHSCPDMNPLTPNSMDLF